MIKEYFEELTRVKWTKKRINKGFLEYSVWECCKLQSAKKWKNIKNLNWAKKYRLKKFH